MVLGKVSHDDIINFRYQFVFSESFVSISAHLTDVSGLVNGAFDVV